MLFNDRILVLDGAMGTMLQKGILKEGMSPEELNVTAPDAVRSVHKKYVEAGADIITTNTFGANRYKYHGETPLYDVIKAGVKLAKEAGASYVALDVGPTGALLKPFGDMDFEEAVGIFKEQITAGAENGADLIIIETMSDILEAKAALTAAKEVCSLPVFVSMSFDGEGRTFLGTSAECAAVTFSSLGADALGVNCSIGPAEMTDTVAKLLSYSTVPVFVQPNAGLPHICGDETCYDVSPKDFARCVGKMADMGVSCIGGCCGTTPEYIKELRKISDSHEKVNVTVSKRSLVTSASDIVDLDKGIAVIGERINPTGKKKLKEALLSKDYDYVIKEAIDQRDCNADILDVNAGLPGIDEKETLSELIYKIQSAVSLPLQIDSSDADAVEAAVRRYRGKPVINSVNGKKESMDAILPIVRKYGTGVVALTLDENGIPQTAKERLLVAEKILREAEKYGIPREDIYVDCLVLTASANQQGVSETLNAVREVREKLSLKTVLGVSNVSFGLPDRELLNSTFLSCALASGLNMPILNPLSEKYMDVIDAYRVINNEDRESKIYISRHSAVKEDTSSSVTETKSDIASLVISGRKGQMKEAVTNELSDKTAIEIINNCLIPALDEVGTRFEKGTFFLPELIASAEAAKAGFDVLAENGGDKKTDGDKIIIATVKGDIHDIGKNIVGMLLSNYGFSVIDLGKDVPPETVVKEVLDSGVKLVVLSALMTTTVKYMKETTELLKESGADCRVMVGGAVVTQDFADSIGADYYAKDAAQAAKIATEVFKR